MKTKPALLLLALPLSTSLSVRAADSAPAPASQSASANAVTPGSILAAQIQEILVTPDLSDKAKQRQIASAVRLAIATAMTNLTDPQVAARLVTELADAAAATAPDFGDLIFRTVTTAVHDTPLLAGQAGLVEALRDVVTTAIDSVVAGNEAAGAVSGRGNGDDQGRRGNQNNQDTDFHGHHDDVIVSPSH